LNTEGLNLRGARFHSSTLHQILRKRLYCGDFDWNGTTYSGTHEPLVSRERWQRVQELLNGRAEKKTRKVKHDFAFTGLVQCGHCGCLMVGELKKRRYVYYHCTGNRGKCPEPYTREETLAGEFSSILRDLVIPRPVLDWLGDALLESDRTEHATRQQAIKRLRVRHEQIEARIETMYTDKLDGRITQEQFDRRSGDCWREQEAVLAKIRHLELTAPAPVDQAIEMMGLMSRASELFLEQPAAEKRRLLQVVIEKAAWKGGQLQTALFEPFEILRRSNQESSREEKENAGSGCVSEISLLG
jgi:site-specific DNA recombinase